MRWSNLPSGILLFSLVFTRPASANGGGVYDEESWDLGGNGARTLTVRHDPNEGYSLTVDKPSPVMARGTPVFTIVKNSSYPIWGIWWNDGKDVLFIDENRQLTVLKEDGSRVQFTPTEQQPTSGSPIFVPNWLAWLVVSDDGRYLFFPVATTENISLLWRVEIASGTITVADVVSPGMPSVATNGEELVFATLDDKGPNSTGRREAYKVCRYRFGADDLSCPNEIQGLAFERDHFGQPRFLSPPDFSKMPPITRRVLVTDVPTPEVGKGSRGAVFRMVDKLSPTTGAVVAREPSILGECLVVEVVDGVVCGAFADMDIRDDEDLQVEFHSILDGEKVIGRVLKTEWSTGDGFVRQFNVLSKQPAPKVTHARIRPLGYPPPRINAIAEAPADAKCMDISFSVPGTAVWMSCWIDAQKEKEGVLIDGHEYVFRDGILFGIRSPLPAESGTDFDAAVKRHLLDDRRASASGPIADALAVLVSRLKTTIGKPSALMNKLTDAVVFSWENEGEGIALVHERGDATAPYVYYNLSIENAKEIEKQYASIVGKVRSEIDGYSGIKWLNTVTALQSKVPGLARGGRCEFTWPGAEGSVECWEAARRGGGSLRFIFARGLFVGFEEVVPVFDNKGHRKWLDDLLKKYGSPNRVYPAGDWKPRELKTEDPEVPVILGWLGEKTELVAIIDPTKNDITMVAETTKWYGEKSRLAVTAFPNAPFQRFVYNPARGSPAARGTTELLSKATSKLRPVRVPGYSALGWSEYNRQRLTENGMPMWAEYDYNGDGTKDAVVLVSASGYPKLLILKGGGDGSALLDTIDLSYRLPAYVLRGDDCVYVSWSFHSFENEGVLPSRGNRFHLKKCRLVDNEEDDGDTVRTICR